MSCVSGSSTAILPLPCLATSLSCAIAEKSFVKSFGETETVPCLLFVLEDEPPPLPHATRPTVSEDDGPHCCRSFQRKVHVASCVSGPPDTWRSAQHYSLPHGRVPVKHQRQPEPDPSDDPHASP